MMLKGNLVDVLAVEKIFEYYSVGLFLSPLTFESAVFNILFLIMNLVCVAQNHYPE